MLGKRGRAAIQRTSSIACMSNRFSTINGSSINNADHVIMNNEQSLVKRADYQQGLAANCKAKSGANPVAAGANIPQIIGFHPVNYSTNYSAQADQLNHAQQQQQQQHMIMINPKGPGTPVNVQFTDGNCSCGPKVQQLQQPLMGINIVTSAAGSVNLNPTASCCAPRSALQTLLAAARQVHMDINEGIGSIKGTTCTVGNPLERQNISEEEEDEDEDEDEKDDDEEEEESGMESFLCYDNSCTQEIDLGPESIPSDDWLPIDLRMGSAVQGMMEGLDSDRTRRAPPHAAEGNDGADGDCFKQCGAGDEGKGLVLYLATPPAFNNIMSPVLNSTPAAKSSRRSSSRASFLDACFLCKRPLGQGLDIFIYRGDAAFCSAECRYQQMLMEERQQIISHDRHHNHHPNPHHNHRPNPHYPKQIQFCSMANEAIRHARTAAAAR